MSSRTPRLGLAALKQQVTERERAARVEGAGQGSPDAPGLTLVGTEPTDRELPPLPAEVESLLPAIPSTSSGGSGGSAVDDASAPADAPAAAAVVSPAPTDGSAAVERQDSAPNAPPVRSGSSPRAGGRRQAQPAETEGDRRVGKRSNASWQQVSLYVSRDVYAQTQIRLIQDAQIGGPKRDFSDVVDGLLQKFLRGQVKL